MLAETDFFTLSCELRDMVYKYLTHDRDITWCFEIAGGTYPFRHTATIRALDLPAVGVVLVNSQMYSENIGASCFHLTSVIVGIN
jgi:hypothetical protein